MLLSQEFLRALNYHVQCAPQDLEVVRHLLYPELKQYTSSISN